MMSSQSTSIGPDQLRLSVVQGNGETRQVICSHFPLRIGRDDQADIILTGLWVGKQHAEIRRTGSEFKVLDFGTLAGTLVNAQRITEYGPLLVGDLVQIGVWTLRIDEIGSDRGGASGGEQAEVDRAVRLLRGVIDVRRKDWQGVSDGAIRAECRELLIEVLRQDAREAGTPGLADQERFVERVIAESVGLGPLEELFADPEISEIMVNRHDQIFVEKGGLCEQSQMRFSSEESVRAVIDRIVSPIGRRIDDASPMVDARLADGSRVNAVIRPLAVKGSSLTIRRFLNKTMNASDLVRRKSASTAMLAFLECVVANRLNVIVSGGTGSGKTTLLNLLSRWIPAHERLVTIEDAAELRLDHPNLVSLEVRPSNAEGQGGVSVRDLLRNALRMRPDRIVVGECRGGEALDMLQAMNTGHEGSLTTIHANSPRDALSRLEVMVLMAGFDLPLVAIREQVASAVDIIIQQQRGTDGIRRIVSVSEVTGVESGVIQTQELFSWRSDLGQFSASGVMPDCLETLAKRGVIVPFEACSMHDSEAA